MVALTRKRLSARRLWRVHAGIYCRLMLQKNDFMKISLWKLKDNRGNNFFAEEWEKRSGGKFQKIAACFYQEYANKCMLEGDTSGMRISSLGTTSHANVLIGQFARRSAI